MLVGPVQRSLAVRSPRPVAIFDFRSGLAPAAIGERVGVPADAAPTSLQNHP
jgi:hypothetical protein